MLCPRCGKSTNSTQVSLCDSCEAIEKTRAPVENIESVVQEIATPIDESFPPAGFWIRVVSSLVDYVSFYLLIFVFFLIFAVGFGTSIALSTIFGSGLENTMVSGMIILIASLVLFIFLYIPVCEYAFGGTLGKLALGLRVVNKHGEYVSFLQAIARQILRVLNALIFYTGILLILFTKDKQTLHDYVTSSYVIKYKEVSYLRIFSSIILSIFFILVTQFLTPKDKNHSNSYKNLNIPSNKSLSIPSDNKISGDTLGDVASENIPAMPTLIPSPQATHVKELSEFERRVQRAHEMKKTDK